MNDFALWFSIAALAVSAWSLGFVMGVERALHGKDTFR